MSYCSGLASSTGFQSINRGYDSVFRANRLSLGLVVPIEGYSRGSVPTMKDQVERIQLAETLGFAKASGQYYNNDKKRFASPHPDALDDQKNQSIVRAIEDIL